MKILVVDDHAVVREGVSRLLVGLPKAVVLEAAGAQEAFAIYRKEQPAIVILDINLEGSSGLELLQRLKVEDRNAKVIMFSMHVAPTYVARAIKVGASGYVSKSASAGELVNAVKRVAEGERYIDEELARDLIFTPTNADDPLQSLTNREVELLRLLGEGKSLNEIAQTFGIAYKTVANSCSRLKEKLGLQRTADLIRVSIETQKR